MVDVVVADVQPFAVLDVSIFAGILPVRMLGVHRVVLESGWEGLRQPSARLRPAKKNIRERMAGFLTPKPALHHGPYFIEPRH